ncbi:glycosyltransferase [Neorhodopirellula lusitana]|uniref:glycosyltransferase n=1 Tax=Neorhodopirellula lusitana TaxID=445327 RepID=UPI00384AC6A3
MTKTSSVTLVIPGKNCEKTLGKCLDSVVGLLKSGDLTEIIFVNDGSTDSTADIAAKYPITVLAGKGEGPGSARNLGWRHATTDLVWFIDSDCVARPDALSRLLPHIDDDQVAGVGGSYDNLHPESLLATLIHEEIIARHRRMPAEVNFLATFNVLYRREVLAEVNGFDETLKLAQDAELAYRIRAAGHRLRFDILSKVGHHHPTNLWRYLKTQARQGYYRMALYRRHPGKMKGDSYASLLDYVQPPLAMLTLASLPLLVVGFWSRNVVALIPCILAAMLFLLQFPMTSALIHGSDGWQRLRVAGFAVMSFVRSFARGVGMTLGALASDSSQQASTLTAGLSARQNVSVSNQALPVSHAVGGKRG